MTIGLSQLSYATILHGLLTLTKCYSSAWVINDFALRVRS